jgi:hypothetical protein
MPPLLWGSAQLCAAGTPRPWLWQGYLAPGAVTLLTAPWKAGKTTLAAILLARLRTGGQLAGLPLAAGKALVVSEEGPEHWQRRHRQLDLGDHVGWFCRPFRGRPRLAEWSAFVDGLAEMHARLDVALVVIDPLAAFLPGNENQAGCMVAALLPLQRLTARGLSVLVLHHPRKGEPPLGHAARGSGALSGSADILIEMRLGAGAPDDDRRRWLWASSRYEETPRHRVIEWTADGTDYVARGTFVEEDFAHHWESLRSILARATHKLTRIDIHEQWPAERVPDMASIIRWLEKAVAQGLLRKDGLGQRGKPYRYWLPEREEEWRRDRMNFLRMPELFRGGV